MSRQTRLLLPLLISFSLSSGCSDIEAPQLIDDVADVTDHDISLPDDTSQPDDECPEITDCLVLNGENTNVVFVHPAGDDHNSGLTSASPRKSIASAILLAKTEQQRPYVLVAAGEYAESILLEDGISILGGYDPDSWERDITTHHTIIKGDGTLDTTAGFDQDNNGTPAEYKTIIAQNLTKETILSGLTIQGQNADPEKNGASTFALWSLNSQNLIVQDSSFIAGTASKGADGSNATAVTAADCSGVDNAGGEGGTPINTDPCADGGLAQASHGEPGKTGTGEAPNNATQVLENGGEHICGARNSDISGKSGIPGISGTVGTNSIPKEDFLGTFTRSNNAWSHAPHATPPQKGENGHGGQGGGAGGNHKLNGTTEVFTLSGGKGGDGGKGGCGGNPGENGYSGGSSFGIAVLGGKTRFDNVHITLGKGGDGGKGSTPSEGSKGIPGLEGSQGASISEVNKGGTGGWGGTGGPGGPGGKAIGGNGGNAIGLAYTDDSTIEEISPITYEEDSGFAGQQGEDDPVLTGQTEQRNGKVLTHQKFPHSND